MVLIRLYSHFVEPCMCTYRYSYAQGRDLVMYNTPYVVAIASLAQAHLLPRTTVCWPADVPHVMQLMCSCLTQWCICHVHILLVTMTTKFIMLYIYVAMVNS